jgi:TolA-binding protein
MNRIWILLILLAIFSQSIYSQSVKSAFKALDEKNYTKARLVFTQLQADAELSVLGDYGLAVVQKSTQLRKEDLQLAYQSIQSAASKWSQKEDDFRKKYAAYCTESKIETEKASIEQIAFAITKKENNVAAFQSYIDNYPKSIYRDEALTMRDAKAWQDALKFNSINAFQAFISQFPNAVQVEDARSRMLELAWNNALLVDEIEAYQAFINTYPEAPQVGEAQTKMVELEYQQAVALNSSDVFESFIQKYPQSVQASLLLKKDENNAYQNAIQFEKLELCNQYLECYPNTKNTVQVMQIRDSLAFLKASEINTPEAYQDFIMKYPKAKQCALVMGRMNSLLLSKAELQLISQKNMNRQRKLKAYTCYQKDAMDTTKKVLLLEKRFDIFGNCIYHFESSLNGKHELLKYQYDNTGDRLLKAQRFVDSRIQVVTQYNYNIKGLQETSLSNCLFDCKDSTTQYHDTLIYDAFRNLLSRTQYNAQAKKTESDIYRYNAKGELAFQTRYTYKMDSLINTNTFEFHYDGMGNLVQKTAKDKYGITVTVDSYSYDGFGQPITSTHFDSSGTLMRTYFYDERGLLKNEIMNFEDYSGKESIKIYQYQFRYGE